MSCFSFFAAYVLFFPFGRSFPRCSFLLCFLCQRIPPLIFRSGPASFPSASTTPAARCPANRATASSATCRAAARPPAPTLTETCAPGTPLLLSVRMQQKRTKTRTNDDLERLTGRKRRSGNIQGKQKTVKGSIKKWNISDVTHQGTGATASACARSTSGSRALLLRACALSPPATRPLATGPIPATATPVAVTDRSTPVRCPDHLTLQLATVPVWRFFIYFCSFFFFFLQTQTR